MAGLYLHIPFCKQACVYCDFHFSTLRGRQEEMVAALIREAGLRRDYLPQRQLKSIYFGGGTPSLLQPEQIAAILTALRAYFSWDQKAEISLEANPDDLSLDYLKALRQTGLNRLSIGIQSFRESDLRFMNRAHSAAEARQSLHWARAAGFDNITIDLIYGLPEQSAADWQWQLAQLQEEQIPHFSAYALTVEPKTVLHKRIASGRLPSLDEERAAEHFALLQDFAGSQGYRHYELSNLAQPGWEARHNSHYWSGRPYLGLGPSAHSYDGESRQWNIANNPRYLKAIKAGVLDCEREHLGTEERYNERVMTALRLERGLDLEALKRDFGSSLYRYCQEEAAPLLAQGRLLEEASYLRVARDWRFHSDGLAAALFALPS